MGIFSKLFGDKASIIDDIAAAKKQELLDRLEKEKSDAETSYSTAGKDNAVTPKAPSGFSWGPEMPDEENQYNYNGTYKEYFNDVFRTEFPDYTLESADTNNGRATVFIFYKDGQKALVVELLSRKSSADKLRSDCRKERLPYLRYYYDYHGWWNTREYVKQRTRNALNG